jgi:5,10-methylenetetrahydrofolate reductase
LILCILGDHPAGEITGVSVRQVVAMAREAVPGATIGATLNQYGADRERSLSNLLGKLRAGASYVQLQPVFELAAAEWFAQAIDREMPEVKVVAMVMPLLSIEAAERIEDRLGIRLPSALREVLATGSEDAAWEAFEATLRELVASPFVDGAAIMTFEPDAAPDAGKRILSVLRRCGALD